jgi:predicted nucleic acid-binding Zn ribbon protein
MACDNCQQAGEFIVPMEKRHEHPCPSCGCRLRVVVGPVGLAGIIWSNPVMMGDGTVVTTNREFREYHQKTGTVPVSTNDESWRATKDALEERASSVAVKLGYTDFGDMRKNARYKTQET